MKKILQKFNIDKKKRISSYENSNLKKDAKKFFETSIKKKYSYNFTWGGLPIIQYPQDIIMFQEIIFKVKPDLIIETGIAHGGSIILSSSMLSLLDISEKRHNKNNTKRKVIAIDIDIRNHNLIEIKKSPFFSKIELIEGSSTSSKTFKKVAKISKNFKKIMVLLDSNHTHNHVLKELALYTPLVSKNSYCIVSDTFIDELNDDYFKDRSWSSKKNPKTAIYEFLKTNKNFKVDKSINNQLLITSAPDGYIKKIK